jgi:hypothetical protein
MELIVVAITGEIWLFDTERRAQGLVMAVITHREVLQG